MQTSDLIFWLLSGLAAMSAVIFWLSRTKATNLMHGPIRLHSQPGYYGWYGALMVLLPAMIVAVFFGLLHLFHWFTAPSSLLLAVCFLIAAAGGGVALSHINVDFRSRDAVERMVRAMLFAAATVSILVTIGIVFSVLFESIQFFKVISFWEFITGTRWEPDTAFLIGAGREGEGGAVPHFGSVPIFAGTFMITAIAMVVAVPVGLFSAIYMSEYATNDWRNRLKPMLEILAGIPTVVYGFFAAITISPLVVKFAESMGYHADYTNALAPGLIMGIMIIPFMSSLSDDVIRAVPQSLRDGSLALGTTKAETIRHVVLPAAMPGIVAAFLIAVSRAIGETMIVVMAAGLRPNLTANPLEGMTTVTVKIVEALTGDQEFDSAFTLAAFALGMVLLTITLVLNIISSLVVRKFRQRYE